ncbi:hypothetical protein KC323_g8029 [Hortaea werneckii]|nr:hypothetical protein KC323_g8029 [Hortaea werneckii]
MLRDIYAPIFLRLQQLGPNVYLPVGYRAADLGKFIDEDVLPAIIESNARCVTSHSAAVQPSGTRNALRERLTITRDVYSQGLYPHDMPSGDIQHALTRISICEESIDDLYRDPHSGVNGCLTSAIERFQKEWDVGGNGGWKEDHMRRLERNLGHWAAFCADEKPNVEPLSLLPMGGQL